MTNDRMTDEEIKGIERRLCEVLGTDHCDVADFACRNLIRTLGEVKTLRQENAALRRRASGTYPAVVDGGEKKLAVGAQD